MNTKNQIERGGHKKDGHKEKRYKNWGTKGEGPQKGEHKLGFHHKRRRKGERVQYERDLGKDLEAGIEDKRKKLKKTWGCRCGDSILRIIVQALIDKEVQFTA